MILNIYIKGESFMKRIFLTTLLATSATGWCAALPAAAPQTQIPSFDELIESIGQHVAAPIVQDNIDEVFNEEIASASSRVIALELKNASLLSRELKLTRMLPKEQRESLRFERLVETLTEELRADPEFEFSDCKSKEDNQFWRANPLVQESLWTRTPDVQDALCSLYEREEKAEKNIAKRLTRIDKLEKMFIAMPATQNDENKPPKRKQQEEASKSKRRRTFR